MEAIKPVRSRRAEEQAQRLHYAEPAAAPSVPADAPMALVPLAADPARADGAAPAPAVLGPPPAPPVPVPVRPGARQISLVQMLRMAQDQLRSLVPDSPAIAAEPAEAGEPLDLIGSSAHADEAICSPHGEGAERQRADAVEPGQQREPGARHLIIGHGDRTHYLAMAALTLGAAAAPATTVPPDWHSLELAPVSRAACLQRCRRRDSCDPLDPCGCGGVFCDQHEEDIG